MSGEGKSTVDIVVRHCVTREQQDAAIAALSFKCDVLLVHAGRHRLHRGMGRRDPLGPFAGRKLAARRRCTYDKTRDTHVLLFPEGVLVPNETAAAVLSGCATVSPRSDEIAPRWASEYDGVGREDVTERVWPGWRAAGWSTWMAERRRSGMLAELTHRCPLHCPYCSNPVELVARATTS